jgi:ribosome-binding protein aMBF1 (putative translation factor)
MNSARKRDTSTTGFSTSSTARKLRSLPTHSRRKTKSLQSTLHGQRIGKKHLKEPPTRTQLPSASVVIDTLIGKDEELREMVRQEVINSEISRMIYDARTAAKLTQQQLADRIGTTQSVISRLESSDYDGHSLGILQRIAEALGQKLELRFSAAV